MKKGVIIVFAGVLLIAAVGFLGREPRLLYISRLALNEVAKVGWVSGTTIVRINVPFHRQEHSLSCEVASLQMALEGVGISVSEAELVNNLAFDPTPKANGIWGDPYKGFVGSIDGKMPQTGYGVYWDPIARLGLRYTRTEVIRDGSLQHLTAQLDQGRPVVVWGHTGSGSHMTWRTPQGQTITAVNGEHARVLIGYTGDSANPDTMIVMDPIYGEQQWKASDFMNNWSQMERGAVAVYPTPRWAKGAGDDTIFEISTDGKTKYGLAMTWENFLAQGGVPEGIMNAKASWMDDLQDGGKIFTLPPQ